MLLEFIPKYTNSQISQYAIHHHHHHHQGVYLVVIPGFFSHLYLPHKYPDESFGIHQGSSYLSYLGSWKPTGEIEIQAER